MCLIWYDIVTLMEQTLSARIHGAQARIHGVKREFMERKREFIIMRSKTVIKEIIK